MTEKIKELRDFYLLDGKLLYISKEFIGFDPIISKGMSYERTEKSGTKMKLEEFEMGEFLFNALLIESFSYGPVSGHKRIDIFRNGESIISHEHGGKMCWNYEKGNDFYLENNNAFLVKDGNAMRYDSTRKIYRDFIEDQEYFFWFRNIVIPEKGKTQEQLVRDFIESTQPKEEQQRVYINIAEMHKAGMSKEEVIEKVKAIFREKGFLK